MGVGVAHFLLPASSEESTRTWNTCLDNLILSQLPDEAFPICFSPPH